MSNISVVASFTLNNGDNPATGLTLAELDLYLSRQHISTGAVDVLWDGTQNPAAEIANLGKYLRIYVGADLSIYNYHAGALYTGVAAVGQNWVTDSVGGMVFPNGPIDYTYITYEPDTVTPVSGVEIFISRLNPTGDVQDAPIIWSGLSDSGGIALDIEGNLPRLDAAQHFFWRQKTGYSFTDPDIETVS